MFMKKRTLKSDTGLVKDEAWPDMVCGDVT
jgi:hypothetical protein